MQRSRLRRVLLLAGLAAGLPAMAAGQSSSTDRYLDYDGLTQAVRALASQHGDLARVTSLTRTDGGRDVWLLTLGRNGGVPLESRPALLVVANLEANHLIGSNAALHTAERLLTSYATDPAVRELLDGRTIYVIPRANPDGAQLAFTMPQYEIPYKPFAGDPSRGGLNARELGRDLNGDGLITVMRVRDPEGTLLPDTANPLLLKEGCVRARSVASTG
jgi:murein tripeptide amidase MpaA